MKFGLQVGGRTPEFSLIGSDGMIHTLVDYKGYKGVCFFFFSKDCEKSQVALKEMQKLKLEYSKKSIAFVGIYRKKDQESFSGALEDLKDLKVNFDLLLDGTKDLINKFGVDVFPYFFIFNQSKHLIYKGRAKDQLENSTSKNYLAQALDQVNRRSSYY